MHKYIIKRLLMMIPVMLGVIFVVYFIMELAPGDPAVAILGENASDEALQRLREELGLNRNFVVRYFSYVQGLLQGDWGTSYRNRIDVLSQILERFPATLLLAMGATIIAIFIGIPVGILAAKKQNTLADRTSTFIALIGVSMPVFWLGLLLVIAFSLNLRWLPSQGMGNTLPSLLLSLILPSVTLSMYSAAMILRMTRSSMLEVIRQDYVDTARAKGVDERRITFHHMFRNALIPIVTSIGLQFGSMLGGAVVTETVFAWPGLGTVMINAIKGRDIPMVLGTVVFLCLAFSIVNLIVDILYAFIDPRIKSQYQRR